MPCAKVAYSHTGTSFLPVLCVKHGVLHTRFICRVKNRPFHIRDSFSVCKTGHFTYGDFIFAGAVCKTGHFTYGIHLPCAKVAFSHTGTSFLPFYYRRLAGNIPDVSTTKVYLKELELLGYSKVKVVKDRGFYSVENINALYKEHIKFVISVLRRPTRFPPESRKSLPKKPSISLRTISFKFTKGSFPVFSIWQE